MDYGLACYYLIAPSEASANLARYDGVRYGLRADGDDFREMVMRTRHDGFGDEPKRRIMLGTYALSSGYYDAYYASAQKVRTLIKREHDALFERFDLLVSPTCATTAFPIGEKAADPLAMYLTDLLTIPSNMAGLPSMSMPCGLSDGLPGRPPADRPAVLREHALHASRTRSSRRSASTRSRSGLAVSASTWEPVIGLEIHVQLKTRTKMFCRCPNGSGGGPNTQTCPVCLAFPGALPVPNRRAIEETIKLGLALGCTIADRAVFHRKNYFYPDLPEGVPDQPVRRAALRANGRLTVPTPDGDVEVGIIRAHLEEDAAKNVHVAASGRIHGATATLVDFNRGGTPLLEIVTAPDIHSADVAKRFLQLLRQTVVELGLSDAELEKGSMRFDVNVSVRPAGSDELRTRTELKNMNSFNFAAKGIEREIARQIGIYEAGGEVQQETLHFDPTAEDSPPLRSKEEAEDYRYFPEPDLVPVHPPGRARRRLRARGRRAAGARGSGGSPRRSPSTTPTCSSRAGSTGSGRRSSTRAPTPKETANVLANAFVATGVDPERVERGRAREARSRPRRDPARGLRRGARALGRRRLQRRPVPRPEGGQRRQPSSTRSSSAVIAANAGEAEQYRGGKQGLLGFFVGQVMKETGGKRRPARRQRAAAREARRMTASRRPVCLAAVVLAAGWALGCAAAASGLPPFTTAPKSLRQAGETRQPEVYRLTATCHPTFDRLVIRSRFGNPNVDAEYVPHVDGDPSGLRIRLPGRARIHLMLQIARAHTTGGASLLPSTVTPLCPNLRQVKLAGDFEGYVSFGLGLQRRAGFRIWQATAPNRIVIDVAH